MTALSFFAALRLYVRLAQVRYRTEKEVRVATGESIDKPAAQMPAKMPDDQFDDPDIEGTDRGDDREDEVVVCLHVELCMLSVKY